MKTVIIYVITLLPSVVVCKDYFTAAVFEHRPRATITPEADPIEVKSANIKFFIKAVKIAAEHKTDIIVFNEYGILPYPGNRENMRKYVEHVPDPQKYKTNPCLEKHSDRFLLTSMSCLARDHDMYIVINMLDIQECEMQCDAQKIDNCESKCSDDGVLIYNTDVVFDREGYIVARYHKLHPYFELVDTPEEPEFITFDTEFGRFGIIVCFDSVFEESHRLVKDYAIDTLIFPTYWFDDITILNAVELQQAWALAHKVNFLGSNAQNVTTGTLGSGIYSKDLGALVYTYDNDADSKLLLANINIGSKSNIPDLNSIIVIREDEVFPKPKETGENFPIQCYKNFTGPVKDFDHDYRCFKYQTENYTLTQLQDPSGSSKSCNNGFCCNLKYETEGLQDVWYLAALNGSNNVLNYYHWWEETCLLVRCDSFNGKECVMMPSTSKTIFKSVELSAKFNAQVIYPSVSKSNYRLAAKYEWSYSTEGDETVLRFKSDSRIPLLKTALLGRNFEQDPTFVPWYQYTVPDTFFM